ncbi:MAG: DinB family protein [Acidobacteriota bacterium]|nr:DinB family protein [Acidobacteriota bacterium]
MIAACAVPTFAQSDVPATLLAHLKTSRAFTLKVAEQMPEATYDFKLTPPQMSFAGQLVHLSQALDEYLSAFKGEKAARRKPASMNKKDVIAFLGQSFDGAIATVAKLTAADLAKTYTGDSGKMTGLEVVMAMFDHTTHHRASAEMYLRAKGITPAEYQF